MEQCIAQVAQGKSERLPRPAVKKCGRRAVKVIGHGTDITVPRPPFVEGLHLEVDDLFAAFCLFRRRDEKVEAVPDQIPESVSFMCRFAP